VVPLQRGSPSLPISERHVRASESETDLEDYPTTGYCAEDSRHTFKRTGKNLGSKKSAGCNLKPGVLLELNEGPDRVDVPIIFPVLVLTCPFPVLVLTRPFLVLVLSPDVVGGHGWAWGTESTRPVEVHICIASPCPFPLNEVVGYIKFKPEIFSSQSGLSSKDQRCL